MIFYAFGDWGENSPSKKRVEELMKKFSNTLKPSFLLPLGDNFYDDGVLSVNDAKWRTVFTNAFRGGGLSSVSWYPILGNHDYLGDPDAQVRYRKDQRWKMAFRYYYVNMKRENVQIFLLDTVGLAPQESARLMGPRILERRGVNAAYKDTQLRWLSRVLSESTARWKIVCGHYPIYSCGEHGDTPELVECLDPILRRYGVHLYLSGHDHSFQHITKNGIHYVVSGCVSRKGRINPTAPEFGNLKSSILKEGFTCIRVNDDSLKFDYVCS